MSWCTGIKLISGVLVHYLVYIFHIMGILRKSLFRNSGKQWKCSSCEKYLSIFPIYCCSSESSICGRCVKKNYNHKAIGENFERQWLFESIAHLLVFPCSYDIFGCKAELESSQVMKHESSCPFRNTVCPLSKMNQSFLSLEDLCDWRGDNQDLISHIRSCHSKYFKLKSEITADANQTFFFFVEDLWQVFMVIFKYLKDEHKYLVSVYSNLNEVECNFFRYQLEFWDNSDVSVVFRCNRVEPLHDQIFKGTAIGCGFKIDMIHLQGVFNIDHYNFKLSLTKKKKKQLKSMMTNQPVGSVAMPTKIHPTRDLTVNDKLLQQIECIVCKDYMFPPIFLCVTGHSVCNYCTKFVTACPACRCQMTSTRNYHLEQLAESLDYPCRNKTLGCSFIASFENFKKHELICEYTRKPCLFQCPWNGDNTQMIIHLQQNHELFNLDDLIVLKMTPQRKKLSTAVIQNNFIFQFIVLWSSSSPLTFSLYSLSCHVKHTYQLHLIDKSNKKLDVIVNYLCPKLILNSDKKYVRDDKNESKLPYEILKQVINENGEIFMKLTIFEIVS